MTRTVSLCAPIVGAFVLLSAGIAQAAGINNFNTVVVQRTGDGGSALSKLGAPIFLDEYSISFTGGVPSASLTQTIAVPHDSSTASVVGGGTASLEGGLNKSTDGQYIMFNGYNADVGTDVSPIFNSFRRMVGRVNIGGASPTVQTSQIYGSGALSAGQEIYSTASTDGTNVWMGLSGTGNGAPSIYYYGGDFGKMGSGSLSTQLVTSPDRRVKIFNDGNGHPQLYITSVSASSHGIATIGSGLPQVATPPVTELSGMPTTDNASPMDFYFANPNTLYVADDRTDTNGGLQKWIQSGGTWSLAYTKNITTSNSSIENGIRGLDGSVDANGDVILFSTTTFGTAGTPNFLVAMTDSLANVDPSSVAVTSLVSTGTNTTLRGVVDLGVVPPTVATPEPGVITVAAVGMLGFWRRRQR